MLENSFVLNNCEHNLNKKTILIIDPLASTEYLLDRFNEVGYAIIALKTIDENIPYCDYSILPYHRIIRSTGNIDNDVKMVLSASEGKLIAGFYGIEVSVAYADKILSRLFPNTSNCCKSSIMRYSKYHMIEASSTVNKIEQLLLNDSINLNKSLVSDFFDRHPNGIIIKPNSDSAGSYGVFCPQTKNDIDYYFRQNNFLFNNQKQNTYVIQEKLEIIDEFHVDCVSYHGNHIATSIGKYKKRNLYGEIDYLWMDNVDIKSQQSCDLISFAYKCLNSIGFNFGLSHIEIVKNSNGLYLMEVNPRIGGLHGFTNKVAKLAYGYDQIDTFIALIHNSEIKLNLKSNFQRVLLPSEINYNKISTCSSVKEIYVNNRNVSKRSSLVNIPGLILLDSESITEIEKDTKILLKDKLC